MEKTSTRLRVLVSWQMLLGRVSYLSPSSSPVLHLQFKCFEYGIGVSYSQGTRKLILDIRLVVGNTAWHFGSWLGPKCLGHPSHFTTGTVIRIRAAPGWTRIHFKCRPDNKLITPCWTFRVSLPRCSSMMPLVIRMATALHTAGDNCLYMVHE